MPVSLETLNEPQREAVLLTEGPLLVLAGAGSGKTRVLTHRIANLIENENVAPWQILAITFTNKAAAEMRTRIAGLIGASAHGMWVSTFHSMCVRILRADAERIGFKENFTIYDTDDLKRLYKEIMAELDLDPKQYPINAIANRISQAKNNLIDSEDFANNAHDANSKIIARVYTRLQERLRAANAFDFDDLLLYAYLLLKDNDDVLRAYQERFRYILVDEYQDTNHAQYRITMMLAAAHRNVMVVGDDDQSIYSWRGADVRNILDFESDFPEAHVIKLEQNYRSAGNILAAANAVIANNKNRKRKTLFTDAGDGDKINIYAAADERDEGRWIAGEIERKNKQGVPYDDIAVFYRTNAQSRMLEDMLLRAGVPYRIVGGTRFLDRAEIRDVMAYLTLVVNPADDIAAKRVINVPRRSIGKTTIERIDTLAHDLQVPFLEAAEIYCADAGVRASVRKAVGEFTELIKTARTYKGDLRDVVNMIIDNAGLIEALEAERTEEARSRVENIREFAGVVDEFVQTHSDEDADFEAPHVSSASEDGAEAAEEEPQRVLRGDSLADFIEWVRLRSDLDTMSDDGHAVTLMTIHSAKGLEFNCVFVAGMEESLFPHTSSAKNPASIEEERRLAYVAITRARTSLYLTYAQKRQIFGSTSVNPVSRFIGEIPDDLRLCVGVGSVGFEGGGWEKRGSRRGIAGSGTEAGEGRVFGLSSAYGSHSRGSAGTRGSSSSDWNAKSAAKVTYHVGDMVDHKVFGRGRVVAVDGDTLKVKFTKTGQTKKLMKNYAPLVKIDEGKG